MNVKRKLYEEVAVPNALYGAETLSITVVQKRLNVMEIRYLRIMCGVMSMDSVRNEKVQRTYFTRIVWSSRAVNVFGARKDDCT